METKSFFGPEGLSSTSANHYCNLAKEACRNYNVNMELMNFYSTGLSVIGDDKKKITSVGLDLAGLMRIKDAAAMAVKLHSLIAFFREAIKEKDRICKEMEQYEDSDRLNKLTGEHIELSHNTPVHEDYLTEEDVVKTWTVGEQEKYLSLQAEASVYGKLIHENGPVSRARTALATKIANPIEVRENGRDTLIYDYQPTVSMDEVDELYFSLQNDQRTAQAELNGMKKRIQDALDKDKLEKDEAYRLALIEHNARMTEINNRIKEYNSEMSVIRKQKVAEAQALKIVVPNRLKDVFEMLKSL